MTTTDIVIVGGGTVGSTIARGVIARTDFSVALIEATDYGCDNLHPGFDDRVIALSKRTVEELAALAVDVHRANAVPIKHIQVSDKGAAGLCQLDAQAHNLDAFGQVVALKALGSQLQLKNEGPRLRLFCPATVVLTERDKEGISLTLNNGETVRTSLVVLADGGRSDTFTALGFSQVSDNYQQTALICNVTTECPHQHRAYERFTPDGPLAFLPFDSGEDVSPGHGFSVVWSLPPTQVEDALSCPEDKFIRRLQRQFGWRQGAIMKVSARHAYPLYLHRAEPSFSHRAVVCGNAAQTLHPIAGQGFNLGLRDAVTLVDTLVGVDDPGAFSTLKAYDTHRQDDRHNTISLTDGLVRLFSNNHIPLIAARNLGLVAVDNSAFAKSRFVRQTTGYAPGS